MSIKDYLKNPYFMQGMFEGALFVNSAALAAWIIFRILVRLKIL